MSVITNQNGSSLVLALIVAFILITLVTIVIHFSNTDLKSAQKQVRQTSAYFIAEAGLDRAIYEVNQSLQIGEEPASIFNDSNFKGGSYDVTVTPKINEHDENIGYMVESVGSFENEEEKVSQWVRQPIWPPESTPDEKPDALDFAMYANEQIKVRTLSGLIGLGIIDNHGIKVDGNIHANGFLSLKHDVLLGGLLGGLINNLLDATGDPEVTGIASSTNLSNIDIAGLSSDKKKTYDSILPPEFDFDYAREQAKKSGVYVPHSVFDISLLGLTSTDKIIFIDGDLSLVGLDLLGLSLQDRTIVVNGTITGSLEVGGNTLVSSKLNVIAKKDINFLGAITGLQVNGILFSQENITSAGHIEVDGYMGAKNITCGSGIVSNLLGLLTGEMSFTYDPSVFTSLPSGIGFKKMYVEVVEQEENQ